MKVYYIENKDSGQVFGVYHAESPLDAYNAMLLDGGWTDPLSGEIPDGIMVYLADDPYVRRIHDDGDSIIVFLRRYRAFTIFDQRTLRAIGAAIGGSITLLGHSHLWVAMIPDRAGYGVLHAPPGTWERRDDGNDYHLEGEVHITWLQDNGECNGEGNAYRLGEDDGDKKNATIAKKEVDGDVRILITGHMSKTH